MLCVPLLASAADPGGELRRAHAALRDSVRLIESYHRAGLVPQESAYAMRLLAKLERLEARFAAGLASRAEEE